MGELGGRGSIDLFPRQRRRQPPYIAPPVAGVPMQSGLPSQTPAAMAQGAVVQGFPVQGTALQAPAGPYPTAPASEQALGSSAQRHIARLDEGFNDALDRM